MIDNTPTTKKSAFVVGGFAILFIATFMYFWLNTGGSTPGTDSYKVSFSTDNVGNLYDRGDISTAGVKIGTASLEPQPDGTVNVTMELDSDAAPLHEGATVRVGVKSLIGTSYVDVVDGDGDPIEDGATLPTDAVAETIGVDELIETLDAPTRAALSRAIRSLDGATKGTSDSLHQLMTGLGDLGTEGHTAVDAIAAQSDDLAELVRNATVLLQALDTGRGRVADVVRDVNGLVRTTSTQRESVKAIVRSLPPLLASATKATKELPELSNVLAPVASDLRRSAGGLSVALNELPAVTEDLRGLLPDLDRALKRTPASLTRVPTLVDDAQRLIPEARTVLADVNPMLAYLEPYGQDLGSLFANWGAAMNDSLPNGIRVLRLGAVYNDASFAGNPLTARLNPLHWTNPYPSPGDAVDPGPFRGNYPRLPDEQR